MASKVVKETRINDVKPLSYKMIHLSWDQNLEGHPRWIKNGTSQRFTSNWVIKITQPGRYQGTILKFPDAHSTIGYKDSLNLNFKFELVENPKSLKLNDEDVQEFAKIFVDLIYKGIDAVKKDQKQDIGVSNNPMKPLEMVREGWKPIVEK